MNTKPSFSEIIKSGQLTLVDFSAEWCGPCKALAPVLTDVKEAKDKLTILKVDVDKNPATANAYNIQGVPTLILFKDGQIKWRQSGLLSSGQLQQVINMYS